MESEKIYAKPLEESPVSAVREGRQRRSVAAESKPAKNDALARLLILQSAVAAVAVVIALVMKAVSPGAYSQFKGAYHTRLKQNMSVGEVWSELRQKAEYVFQTYWREEATDGAETGDNGADDEAAPSQTQSEASTALETLSRATGETLADGEITASGGADLDGEEAAADTSFSDYSVSEFPTMPLASKRISSGFGYRVNPVSGRYGFHTGIDLPADEGTPVACVFFGVVEESGENDIWGKYVLVRHSESLQTYYCHCSALLAETGTVVRKGETLALVGSTGWSTGPHLHFEVRINGVRVDPALLLFGERSSEDT